MIGLNRTGFPAFFAAVGGTTVLTGIYLFWQFTDGFRSAIGASHAGIASSVGGAEVRPVRLDLTAAA